MSFSFAVGLTAITLAASSLARAQDPTKLPAVKPPAVQPPQAQIREQILPYIARLTRPVEQPMSFADGSVQGKCNDAICMVTAAAGTSEIQVCQTLARRFGSIESITHGERALSASGLQACNKPNPPVHPLPSQAELPGVAPRPQAEVDKETSSGLREAPAGMPLEVQDVRPLTELPLPPDSREGGAAGVEETDRRRGAREAAAEIREEMARRGAAPQITGFDLYPCLPASNDTLGIEGRRFGAAPGAQRVVLGPAGRRFEVRWVLPVLSWGDERIRVVLPPDFPPPPGEWAVAIADAAGERLSNLRTLRRCPSSFPISGSIAINACGASLENVGVRLVRESPGDGPSSTELSVGPDPYNDLAFRFAGMLGPGAYEVTPRLSDGVCPGGSWSPGSYSVRVSEFDGSPGAPRTDYDFTYDNVPLTTTRIPAVIMTSLIQDLFDGTEIRLNNHGPGSPRGSWYKPDDSWIRLPEALGGLELPLDIPIGRGGAFQYYVRDVNLSAVRVTRQADAVAIRLLFESESVELKGYCWGTNSMIDLDCPVGPDDSAPDVQIDNLIVTILLPPARFGRSPTSATTKSSTYFCVR